MKKLHLYRFLLALLSPVLYGCGGIPKEALSMNRLTLEERELQTRLFDTTDERKILSASERVFQKLGFHLDESKTDLGLIVGSQNPDTIKAGHIILRATLAGLKNIPAGYSQKIRISIVTSPAGEDVKRTSVRVNFQRIIWIIMVGFASSKKSMFLNYIRDSLTNLIRQSFRKHMTASARVPDVGLSQVVSNPAYLTRRITSRLYEPL